MRAAFSRLAGVGLLALASFATPSCGGSVTPLDECSADVPCSSGYTCQGGVCGAPPCDQAACILQCFAMFCVGVCMGDTCTCVC